MKTEAEESLSSDSYVTSRQEGKLSIAELVAVLARVAQVSRSQFFESFSPPSSSTSSSLSAAKPDTLSSPPPFDIERQVNINTAKAKAALSPTPVSLGPPLSEEDTKELIATFKLSPDRMYRLNEGMMPTLPDANETRITSGETRKLVGTGQDKTPHASIESQPDQRLGTEISQEGINNTRMAQRQKENEAALRKVIKKAEEELKRKTGQDFEADGDAEGDLTMKMSLLDKETREELKTAQAQMVQLAVEASTQNIESSRQITEQYAQPGYYLDEASSSPTAFDVLAQKKRDNVTEGVNERPTHTISSEHSKERQPSKPSVTPSDELEIAIQNMTRHLRLPIVFSYDYKQGEGRVDVGGAMTSLGTVKADNSTLSGEDNTTGTILVSRTGRHGVESWDLVPSDVLMRGEAEILGLQLAQQVKMEHPQQEPSNNEGTTSTAEPGTDPPLAVHPANQGSHEDKGKVSDISSIRTVQPYDKVERLVSFELTHRLGATQEEKEKVLNQLRGLTQDEKTQLCKLTEKELRTLTAKLVGVVNMAEVIDNVQRQTLPSRQSVTEEGPIKLSPAAYAVMKERVGERSNDVITSADSPSKDKIADLKDSAKNDLKRMGSKGIMRGSVGGLYHIISPSGSGIASSSTHGNSNSNDAVGFDNPNFRLTGLSHPKHPSGPEYAEHDSTGNSIGTSGFKLRFDQPATEHHKPSTHKEKQYTPSISGLPKDVPPSPRGDRPQQLARAGVTIGQLFNKKAKDVVDLDPTAQPTHWSSAQRNPTASQSPSIRLHAKEDNGVEGLPKDTKTTQTMNPPLNRPETTGNESKRNRFYTWMERITGETLDEQPPTSNELKRYPNIVTQGTSKNKDPNFTQLERGRDETKQMEPSTGLGNAAKEIFVNFMTRGQTKQEKDKGHGTDQVDHDSYEYTAEGVIERDERGRRVKKSQNHHPSDQLLKSDVAPLLATGGEADSDAVAKLKEELRKAKEEHEKERQEVARLKKERDEAMRAMKGRDQEGPIRTVNRDKLTARAKLTPDNLSPQGFYAASLSEAEAYEYNKKVFDDMLRRDSEVAEAKARSQSGLVEPESWSAIFDFDGRKVGVDGAVMTEDERKRYEEETDVMIVQDDDQDKQDKDAPHRDEPVSMRGSRRAGEEEGEDDWRSLFGKIRDEAEKKANEESELGFDRDRLWRYRDSDGYAKSQNLKKRNNGDENQRSSQASQQGDDTTPHKWWSR